ncbi:hypothetical protein BCV72DRAFT_48356 [Rhizopus microsporus var. microsporus]|uniref:Arrestin-like N-terminal domain-containing protein n=2 Tax=Rhizopus microsporus TaxID=58291 RepID=A0A2G4SZ96_RHIZD|nr:uncharacterized protein RHIMIDRAFT_114134 [Rhizopus microsporus ATCC 52813]ORE02505.1 hypothetical protein BCV72DRAFT_48356 [Rhizopus microsporus var. microsporus]PHZ14092.1 hypothetical protein RHIMIDRAFT_114134 [Rhizopus microsporus ATCC 52813]
MTSDNLHIHLDQDVFALDGFRPNASSQIKGYIQLYSESFPTWNIQIQLVGKEQIEKNTRVIIDDTFHLPMDWVAVANDKNVYRLPFMLTVPNNIPISCQVNRNGNGIYYIIQVYSKQTVIRQPIQFYKSFHHDTIPRRVFWGIAKQSINKWQYELEFPNAFDLTNANTGYLSIRLRSNSKNSAGCHCLVICQITQSVHTKGFKNQQNVLMTTSELLRQPNATWTEPYHIEFELGHPMLLPTVHNQGLSVLHSMQITCLFTKHGESDCVLNFDFPLDISGFICPSPSSTPTVLSASFTTNASNTTVDDKPSSVSSISSSNSITTSSDIQPCQMQKQEQQTETTKPNFTLKSIFAAIPFFKF